MSTTPTVSKRALAITALCVVYVLGFFTPISFGFVNAGNVTHEVTSIPVQKETDYPRFGGSELTHFVNELARNCPRSFEENSFFAANGYNMTEWSVVYADESTYAVNLVGEQTIKTSNLKVFKLTLEVLDRARASYKITRSDGDLFTITYDNVLFVPYLP